jgi:hypothetical protein
MVSADARRAGAAVGELVAASAAGSLTRAEDAEDGRGNFGFEAVAFFEDFAMSLGHLP